MSDSGKMDLPSHRCIQPPPGVILFFNLLKNDDSLPFSIHFTHRDRCEYYDLYDFTTAIVQCSATQQHWQSRKADLCRHSRL